MAGVGGVVKNSIANSNERQPHLNELDELAGEPRDIGQLAEPLADSVLDYTLRRLRPKEDIGSPAVQALEEAPCPDNLSQLMNEESELPDAPTHSKLMRIERDIFASVPEQHDGTDRVVAQGSEFWDRIRAPAEPFSNGDWWDLELESLQQPILPYEESSTWTSACHNENGIAGNCGSKPIRLSTHRHRSDEQFRYSRKDRCCVAGMRLATPA